MNKNSLLNKFLSFSVGDWLGAVIGFISTPIITRLLSPDEFGKASMFILAANIISILVIFGTDQTFVRFFYEEDEEDRGLLLLNTLKLPFVLYIVIAIVMVIFADKISLMLFNEVNRWIIYILISVIFFQFLNRFASLLIRMQQKGLLFSILKLLIKLVNLISIIIFAYILKRNYKIMVYSHTTTFIIVTIVAIILGRKYWVFTEYSNRDLKNGFKQIVKYSYPLFFTSLIIWLFQSFDRIAIKYWGNFSELGLYAAAFKIVAILNIIQSSFTTFWTPVSLETYENDPENKAFFRKIYNLISLTMFMIAVVTIMVKDIVIYLLGLEYADAAMIMPFLIFIPIMYTISETTVIGINFAKKPKWHILIAVISCLTNLTGNWLLVPSFGAKGAAISTGISYIVFFTLRTNISLKYYKVDYKLNKSYFILFLLVLYAFHSSFYNWNIINLIIGIMISIIILALNYSFIKRGFLNRFI
ncbi:O-antigen/teichoic acid export membrane protein [Orenia metallireducens]|uniref:lipopolysaccharide biosynthesis protein n=1 Tax=Orenia metallireducens TaxID=1413210 RepID=UPI000D051459|nr:oligosaccharide flippase family protein [Orenia metallireducens]PRX35679.1 O-antigen/teichoic acid export membrane protein [Orenia metallireducens]